MPDGILSAGVFTTDADLRITSWDDGMVQLSRIAAPAAKDRLITELIPDLESRHLLGVFQKALKTGSVEILSSAFHKYLIACPTRQPSTLFQSMQQRVTIAPLESKGDIRGLLVTVEDVTAALEEEQSLAIHLRSDQESARLHAATRLAEQNPVLLAEALKDESWRVRQVAVNGLARQGGKAAIAALLKALREEHRDPGLLNSALSVLRMIDVDVVHPLIDFLRDSDKDLRVYAAQALGDQENPEAIPALITALDDSDSNVRFHALESLGKHKAASARDKILAIACSPDFFLAYPALEALTEIGDAMSVPPLLPLLKQPLMEAAVTAFLARWADAEAVEPLVAQLEKSMSIEVLIALNSIRDRYEKMYGEGLYITDRIRRSISADAIDRLTFSLQKLDDHSLLPVVRLLCALKVERTLPALAKLLSRPSARKEIIEALADSRDSVVDVLIEQINSEDSETKRGAIAALGRLGTSKAVPHLLAMLIADGDLLLPVIGALTKIGHPSSFEPLVALLGHPDAAIRQAAIGALNSLGHPLLSKRAVSLLSHPDSCVRESAARIAGYFGSSEAFENILALCQDSDERVAKAAIENLPFFDDHRIPDILKKMILDSRASVRASAARAFAQVEPSAAEKALSKALDDPDPWVQYYAIRSIGHQRFHTLIEALGQKARGEAVPMHVRAASLEALGKIGGARAVALIAPYVQNLSKDLSMSAIQALGQIHEANVLAPLIDGLKSRDIMNRMEVYKALGRRRSQEVIEAIRGRLEAEDHPQAIQAGIDAISSIGTESAVSVIVALMARDRFRETCVAVLSRQADGAVPMIAQGLDHANLDVRHAVVEVLGRMRRPAASHALQRALSDIHAPVRLAAVMALKTLDQDAARSLLAPLAERDPDERVRGAVKSLLMAQVN